MLHNYAARANKIATEHGFSTPTWENLPVKLMFVITEIDELQVAMSCSNVQPETLAELADIAIRTLAVLGALWPDGWADSRITGRGQPTVDSLYERPEVLLWPMVHQARKAIGYWRNDNQRDVMICLELLLLELWRLADRMRINLYAAIESKMSINEGRPYLHGKKRAEG